MAPIKVKFHFDRCHLLFVLGGRIPAKQGEIPVRQSEIPAEQGDTRGAE